MDWSQTFVIICVFIAGFFYLASKIDGVEKDLRKEIQKNREEILWIKFQHGYEYEEEIEEE